MVADFSKKQKKESSGNNIAFQIAVVIFIFIIGILAFSDIRIYQKDIIEVAKSKMYPATDNIDSGSGYFDYNWLNIEKIYEDAGWAVKYDKPAYNESYDAYFIFREKKG